MPIVLVPSLINPPNVLDLDPEVSLARRLNGVGRVLLLDWGPAAGRASLDLAGHVTDILIPLLRELGESAVLVGYCLGGTLALAVPALADVRSIVTLASPWRFSAYASDARAALATLWEQAREGADALGALPTEVLQAAFWSLDPARVVAKYARLADLAPESAEMQRFIRLEDWANSGEPLPVPAARDLVEDLFGRDVSGRGEWRIGRDAVQDPGVPTLHFTATADLIVPEDSVAPWGEVRTCSAGHVGMIVGRNAPRDLHAPLTEWLATIGSRG
ncbi:alpha/beta fold hydrolase [Sphingomonas arenae]|uniref:alpha/beta fold hydrolase n=1 Tax=Sphingomonas arenae TaxID=2812555 RepID=UPI001967FB2E|nr:alpha/beta fold hydrolase [Sphingomonas arenae]